MSYLYIAAYLAAHSATHAVQEFEKRARDHQLITGENPLTQNTELKFRYLNDPDEVEAHEVGLQVADEIMSALVVLEINANK